MEKACSKTGLVGNGLYVTACSRNIGLGLVTFRNACEVVALDLKSCGTLSECLVWAIKIQKKRRKIQRCAIVVLLSFVYGCAAVKL